MLLEPHLSGTIIILCIGAIMMFVGGTRLAWFGLGIGVGGAGIAGAVLLVPDLVPYAMTRIQMWQDPFNDPNGYQTVQSLYAIASGGLTGPGHRQFAAEASVCARAVQRLYLFHHL